MILLFCLDLSKDDIFTKKYFLDLINNENSDSMFVNDGDIEALWAFVYIIDM